MTDRERVVKTLDTQIAVAKEIRSNFVRLAVNEAKAALRLLKEQEPVPPQKVKRYVVYNDTTVTFPNTYNCGKCGKELPDNAKYCLECGRAVKWDG